ncbi:MAG: M3 family metallopeptidase [Methanococcaceae archaeon]
MKKKWYLFFLIALVCTVKGQGNMENPFFKPYGTPFNTPPFGEIKNEHYLPAFEEGIKQHTGEIDAIISSTEKPTFENTIAALEKSGKLLTKVSDVFFNLLPSNTNDELLKISKAVSPLLSKHQDDINLNEKLFEKVKSIYDEREKLNLSDEQKTLLNNYYSEFVREGVNLNATDKEHLRKLNEELGLLSLKFNENVLKDGNAFILVIEKKEDLSGLPENVILQAAETAKAKGQPDKWAFTLAAPSYGPFLRYSDRRELREKIFNANINRGNNNNEFDNNKILTRIANLRLEKARLLGFKTYAALTLTKKMAKTQETVYKFLYDLWTPALKKAKTEVDELQQFAARSDKNLKLEAWDLSYYSEKLRKEKYDLDDEMLRPYFKLENVREGAFNVASKLYGIQFVERKDIPVYNPDVRVFEVKESDGRHIGLLYTDYYPRESKKVGAWMNYYRNQSNMNGEFIHPLVVNCGNFSKPVGDKPALLSFTEATTMFHEFGHALNGLLANRIYPGGWNNVEWDFIELPSQVMENWAKNPEVIKTYARHYQTNEPIPQELLDKIEKSKYFNQGIATVALVGLSILDMDWHTITENKEINVAEFEKSTLERIGTVYPLGGSYRSTNFLHIFSGGYAAGYYGYIWAQVLDADAYEAFAEKDLFDKELAASFRKNILERNGSEEAMSLYKKFRGREPKVDALLKRKGLN